MKRRYIGLISSLGYEERAAVETELGVLFSDVSDAIDAVRENFLQLKESLDTLLYGEPKGY